MHHTQLLQSRGCLVPKHLYFIFVVYCMNDLFTFTLLPTACSIVKIFFLSTDVIIAHQILVPVFYFSFYNALKSSSCIAISSSMSTAVFRRGVFQVQLLAAMNRCMFYKRRLSVWLLANGLLNNNGIKHKTT